MKEKRQAQINTIKQLNDAFREWDDGSWDRQPLFYDFSKGLINLTSFVDVTLDAYATHKKMDIVHVSKRSKKLQRETKGTIEIGTILPLIIDTYFVPRLFALSYLGAWGLLENYLRDVLRLSITSNIVPGKSKDQPALGVLDIPIDTQKLVDYIAKSPRHNINDLAQLYKFLGIDLNKNEHYRALIESKKERNKLAHTGRILGYESFIDRYMEIEMQQKTKEVSIEALSVQSKGEAEPITIEIGHISTAKPRTTRKNRELERELCSALIYMWKLGDFLRLKLFKASKSKY